MWITLCNFGLHCNGQLFSTWLNYAMCGSNESQKKKSPFIPKPNDTVPIVFCPFLKPCAFPSLFPLLCIPDPNLWKVHPTIDVSSQNCAQNNTFTFVNEPSVRETTMNWEPLEQVWKHWLMCCVCERLRVASILLRMYIGARLNWRRATMRESAIRDLCDNIHVQDGLVFHFILEISLWDGSVTYCLPPLSSIKLCF